MASYFNKSQQAESAQRIADALAQCTRDREDRPIIYTVLRSVSSSGMTRRITAFVIVAGEPISLSWDYDRAYGRMADDSAGCWANKVRGCGMDMGFHLASNIANVGRLENDYSSFRHEWL